ncbi:odorant receptor 102 [Nasonia vitripennis]|uniref:Odorant receptor n=1 Tax=Nasonia vitripennis TaxID=7425 RepID=A0A7M6UPM6_NASVI|nr:odorant receptor 102 [Nasonia vitripennis]
MHSTLAAIVKNNIEYKILPFQFFLLTFLGIWCPSNWSLKSKTAHNVYFTFIFFLDFLICIEMFIHFVSSFGTDNFKLINFFLVSANITAVYKSIRLMQNREVLRYFIISYFDYEWTKSHDSVEHEINSKIDLRIRRVTVIYSASMIGIVLLKAMSPIAESNGISLPVDAWYPYSIEKSRWFWITYLHQVILGSSAVGAHIGIDTLFVGLLLKTSGQIHLLNYRLRNLMLLKECNFAKLKEYSEKNVVLRCIYHHKRIYRFGGDLNDKFQEILFILVVSSLPNICINVYSLSSYKGNINVQYIATIFSTTSALLQFFIACWYGNETTFDSLQVINAVYEMDWTNFHVSTKRLLIFIMLRASKPLKFSVAYIIPMNLDSFIKIIKASYTAFNLLQQTTN